VRDVTGSGKPADGRVVLGDCVRQLIARQRLDKTDVARRAGIGRTTLWRLIEGDPSVTVETMMVVEEVLCQPFGLFRSIAESNLPAIRGMAQLDTDLRSWIIGALSDHSAAPSKSARTRTA
jgi:transcriptional regulator with XRE-family HTH domain